MAFVPAELSLMGYNGVRDGDNKGVGNHFFFYANTAGDDLEDAGFFNSITKKVTTGDLLFDVDSGAFAQLTLGDDNGTPIVEAAYITAQPE
jgi:hypothetical protein